MSARTAGTTWCRAPSRCGHVGLHRGRPGVVPLAVHHEHREPGAAASSSVRSGAVVSWRANVARLPGSLATNRLRRKSASVGVVGQVQARWRRRRPPWRPRPARSGSDSRRRGEDVRELSGVTRRRRTAPRTAGSATRRPRGGEHGLARHEPAEGVADDVDRSDPRGCDDGQQVGGQLGQRVGLGGHASPGGGRPGSRAGRAGRRSRPASRRAASGASTATKSSLLPVNPGTSTAVPRGAPSAGSRTQRGERTASGGQRGWSRCPPEARGTGECSQGAE